MSHYLFKVVIYYIFTHMYTNFLSKVPIWHFVLSSRFYCFLGYDILIYILDFCIKFKQYYIVYITIILYSYTKLY